MKPRDIVCPACNAARGKHCRVPITTPLPGVFHELDYYHAARIDAAIDRITARLDMLSAMARGGNP